MMSVVIPTYGREAQAVRLLTQLIDQDFPKTHYEIILVDQTGYNSLQLQQLVASETVLVKHLKLPFPSIARAWNVGIQTASGDVVIFLDDDVCIDPSFIQSHYSIYSESSDVVGVAGQVLAKNAEPRSNKHWFSTLPQVGWCFFPLSYACQASIDVARGCNFSFLREVAVRVGGIDENYEKTAHCFEPEFCFRLKTAGKILFDPRPRVVHESHPSGGIRSVGMDERLMSDFEGAVYLMLKHILICWWPLFLFSEFRRNFFKKDNDMNFNRFLKHLGVFFRSVGGAIKKIQHGPKYYFKLHHD